MPESNALEELINTLYEMVEDAKTVPLSGDRCLLDREKALDVLDELRANLPSDLKMAREIVEKRNEVIAAGKREYEVMKNQAEEYARQRVNDHDIVVEARRKAGDIIAAAEGRAREIMKAAAEYCDDAMKRSEEAMSYTMDEIKRSRAEFRAAIREQLK